MLKKLVKYEWKATIRTLLPLYLGVILLALINRILWAPWMNVNQNFYRYSGPGAMQGIAMTVYVSVIVASFVVTFVILIQRFYKSLLGDEGYLMFTLPVTPAQNIWAKTIIASIMNVLCAVATTISVVVLGSTVEFWRVIAAQFDEFLRFFFRDAHGSFFLLECFLMLVVGTVSGMLFIYVCIALGHLAKRHRVAGAVLAYFALTTVLQIVGTQFLILLGRSQWVNNLLNSMSVTTALHFSMVCALILSGLLGVGCFMGTNYILSKKLNLE